MDLANVITQLKTHCAVLQKRVAGAAEHELAAENGYLDVPAAYVVPLADDAAENRDLNSLTQVVTESIGVILVLNNTPDRRGQASTLSVEAFKYAVHKALLNWRADPCRAPRGLQYEGGSLLKVDGARLVWQLVYSHEVWISDEDGFIPTGEPLLNIDGRDERLGEDSWSFDRALEQE